MQALHVVSWFFVPLIFLLSEGSSERIVVFHGISSYSHRVQTWPLAVALSERHHDVSYISPYYPKEPHPNISELVPQAMTDVINKFIGQSFDVTLRASDTMPPLHEVMFDMALETCEVLLGSPELVQWLKKTKNVDLFIIDSACPECGYGVAHRVGAKKIIHFNTVAPMPHEYDALGFLPQSSAVPEMDNKPLKVPFGFLDRIKNAIMSIRWRIIHCLYSVQIDTMIRERLNVPKMPFIGDLLRNVSLIFHTGDVVTDYARSLPPLFVDVAGIHCKESTKALPKEMETFINATKPGKKDDGFIYISLGSVVVSSDLPDKIKKVFFDVVKAFPTVKFLWKWEGKVPAEIPDNLFLSKWFPQIDVLGHPKIRAFVTQTGRPSMLEALYLGVPLISFPILGDQDMNANRLADMGATIQLEIGTVTFNQLRDAVQKVVYDPSVKERMTRLQTIFRDRPQTPVETAVWWTEYVLRNEDTAHLRPSGNDQYWFVRRSIDVWVFLSISIFSVLIGTLVVAWKLLNLIRGNQTEKKQKRS